MRTCAVILLVASLSSGVLFAEAVKITKGPVVEHAGPSNAVIAWSTNSPSATIVKFGTDPNNLDHQAQMPWGALTHRVTLENLEPGKTYYFQADSSQGQGTGSAAVSQVGTFTTGDAGASNSH